MGECGKLGLAIVRETTDISKTVTTDRQRRFKETCQIRKMELFATILNELKLFTIV